jgi:arylformamidase
MALPPAFSLIKMKTDMKISLQHRNTAYSANLRQPLDISLAVGTPGPRAWYVPDPVIEPVVMGDFTGSVAAGSSVNFFNITFNPHGHGTHTECLGHVTLEKENINELLKDFFFFARVASILPKVSDGTEEEFVIPGDRIITGPMLEESCPGFGEEAFILRTLPNGINKKTLNYTDTNPPYLTTSAARWLKERGCAHLLLDLPSVDREMDEGRLAVHKIFWEVPQNPQLTKTITEMIFVPDAVADGLYLLNLQVAPFVNDAAPSRPVLFQLEKAG